MSTVGRRADMVRQNQTFRGLLLREPELERHLTRLSPPPHLLHERRDALAGFGEFSVGYGEGDAQVARRARAEGVGRRRGRRPASRSGARPQAAQSPTARQ